MLPSPVKGSALAFMGAEDAPASALLQVFSCLAAKFHAFWPAPARVLSLFLGLKLFG
jgi:hypothetical protein